MKLELQVARRVQASNTVLASGKGVKQGLKSLGLKFDAKDIGLLPTGVSYGSKGIPNGVVYIEGRLDYSGLKNADEIDNILENIDEGSNWVKLAKMVEDFNQKIEANKKDARWAFITESDDLAEDFNVKDRWFNCYIEVTAEEAKNIGALAIKTPKL